jgi:hypothetical protein
MSSTIRPLVFVSHSHKDSAIAGDLVGFIEAHGIACWWSRRDIRPGENWAEAIDAAIDDCDLMLFVLSSHSNHDKDQVLRELEQANSRKIPILTYRIEDLEPSHGIRFFIRSAQFCNAFGRTPAAIGEELLHGIRGLGAGDRRPLWQAAPGLKLPPSAPPVGLGKKRPPWWAIFFRSPRVTLVVTALLSFVLVAAVILIRRPDNPRTPDNGKPDAAVATNPNLAETTPVTKEPVPASPLRKGTDPAAAAKPAAEPNSQNAEEMFQFALRKLREDDDEKSLLWSRRAAEAGHVDAMCLLAEHYLRGIGVSQDVAEATRWYTRAAAAGSSKARHNLDLLDRLTERESKPEQDKAPTDAELMRKAEGGDAEAQFQMGCELAKRNDLDGAKLWIERAARKGWPRAMSEMGTIYFAGLGVAKDDAKAVEWWTKAAAAGCEVGKHNLEVFRQGDGE